MQKPSKRLRAVMDKDELAASRIKPKAASKPKTATKKKGR